MFTRTEAAPPQRSAPLTPRANCFHSVSETEWCRDVEELSSRMQLQLHRCLYTFSHGTLNTHTQHCTDSEKQLPLSSFQPEISEPDMTRPSFRQLSLFVIWRPGFLETSIEFISCVCWGNTQHLSSLEEVKQWYNTERGLMSARLLLLCSSEKIFGKSPQNCHE